MQIAQKLYEGIEIDGEPVGLITYMRTDSVRISDDAQTAAKKIILHTVLEKIITPKHLTIMQKAAKTYRMHHEAIRPSYIERTPDSIKQYLTSSNTDYIN